jgi:hypothetical protein
MADQLSAGINVSEIDLTTIVPSVSTSVGALAGTFRWGPVETRTMVDRESNLVLQFGKPSNLNAETWFTGANFLGYADQLVVVRAANTSGATPSGSFSTTANSTVSNNVFLGNTTGLSAGMYVYQTSNSTIMGAGNNVTVTSVNSTAVVLSTPSTSASAVTLYFAHPETAYSALAFLPNSIIGNLAGQIVKNREAYPALDGTFDSDAMWVAKFPGDMGNSLRVSQCGHANAYSSNVAFFDAVWTNTQFSIDLGSNTGYIDATNGIVANTLSNTYATTVAANFSVGDQVLCGNSTIGTQFLQIASISNAVSNATVSRVTLTFTDPYRLATAYASNTVTRHWEFFNVVDSAPGQSQWVLQHGNTAAQDELHLVVVDAKGAFSGTPGTILEVYKGLSRATDARNADTTGNYYKNVVNEQSQYLWFANDRPGAASANSLNVATSTNYAPLSVTLALGADGYGEANVALAVLASAYDQVASAEDIDISFVMQGKPVGGSTVSGGQTVSNYLLANYLIDNIAMQRKDCVVTITPDRAVASANPNNEAIASANWRNVLHDTSFAMVDSGYKYQYDRYNDIYRWIPLNGDIAGLCARTDQTNDAWWSPAGFNRGQIKNLVRLAWNPRKAARNILYSAGINPVVSFPGEGTVLLGDKTLQSKPSAFDRINVRRLFIVLEKAISRAAKFSLFEFNDPFTRRQFVNLITPYLRDVQGRRGITDFHVKCDEENNTGQVIDSNKFVGDIYIKPARSINFIQLNFVAVGTAVQFSEVVGNF